MLLTALELVGVALIVAGCAVLSIPVALIVAGFCMVLFVEAR